MALDSRQKRAAVIGVGRAWYRNPHPSNVDASQRASIGQVYPVAVFQGIAAPVFSGTIPNLSYDYDTGSYINDYSSYFTGATSYSISPAVEAGWNFDTVTGILTVDTDDINTFGPYTITGTNAGGSDNSNAFTVTVAEAVAETETFTGGWWYAYEQEVQKRKKKQKEIAELEAKAKAIQVKIDRELAEELAEEEKNQERLKELRRLTKLAEQHEQSVTELGDRVTSAYNRAKEKYTYSAMECMEREIKRAHEEEQWLIGVTMNLIH